MAGRPSTSLSDTPSDKSENEPMLTGLPHALPSESSPMTYFSSPLKLEVRYPTAGMPFTTESEICPAEVVASIGRGEFHEIPHWSDARMNCTAPFVVSLHTTAGLPSISAMELAGPTSPSIASANVRHCGSDESTRMLKP